MYQSVRQIDAVRRIDSIMDQTKVKSVDNQAVNNQHDTKSTFSNHPNPKKELFTKEYLESLASDASEAILVVNRELSFRVHEGTGRPFIQLIESETKEVIREIPSEKMLDVVAGIWEMVGLIVDRKE